jgi:hypothetical protein
MIDQPPIAITEEWKECQPLNVRPDGVLVVILSGSKLELEIAGIELPKTPPAAFFEFLGRLHGVRKPIRCRVVGHTSAGRVREIRYFGWQDKSGDIWLDLATTLIEQGFARPADGSQAK